MAHNPFETLKTFQPAAGKSGQLYSLPALAAKFPQVKRLPVSLRIVLESVLRNVDGKKVTEEHVKQLAHWSPTGERTGEIPFILARIVLQDFTGVPGLVDLAAMRNVAERMGKNPKVVEPLVPVDLVVDHSVQIDNYGAPNVLDLNMKIEFARNRERLVAARREIATCAISGAVGTFANIDPRVEEYVAKKLGLAVEPISTQVIPRDRHAMFFAALGVVASSLERLAVAIRHFQRSAVREAEEDFSTGQKGSSAMPHKRNPIVCEQICGLARVVRANAQAAFENVALWHERDISHSSVERVILPDSTILVDYMLNKTTNLVEKMFVYPQRMLENLNLMKGLIFSGQLLLDLTEKGASREDAYRWVQRNAMQVWQTREDFKSLVQRDPDISSRLSAREIATVFNTKRYLKHVDQIFRQVFGK